jgi:hypothetical protein
MRATSVIFEILPKVCKQSPNGLKFAQSGHPVFRFIGFASYERALQADFLYIGTGDNRLQTMVTYESVFHLRSQITKVQLAMRKVNNTRTYIDIIENKVPCFYIHT